MKVQLFIVYLFLFFSLNAQHAREGWIASLAGNLNLDPCNCFPDTCGCTRILIPYDNENDISGSPDNPANQPKGLENSGYILIFEDEFTDAIRYAPASTVGSNGSWKDKKWLTTTGFFNLPNAIAANVADYPDFFTTQNEALGSDKVLNMKADSLTLSDGSRKYVMSEIQSALHYRYGYMEARIQIPKGDGLLPAFWTFAGGSPCEPNTNRYTMYEEIDDFEYFEKDIDADSRPRSYQKPVIHQHYKANAECNAISSLARHIVPIDDARVGYYFLDMSADFFIYGMEWTPTELLFYINNTLVHTQPNYNNDGPTGMRIRLQNMIQYVNNNTYFPANYKVDYVRLYKSPSLWAEMIEGTDEIRVANQNITAHYYPNAFLPDAKYSWAISNNATGTAKINIKPGYDPTWGNVWVDLEIKPNTPTENYHLKLDIILANGTVLPTIDKTIHIIGKQ